MTQPLPLRTRIALERARVAIDDALTPEEDFGGPDADPPTPGTRTKAEIVADYRRGKARRGECRDCTNPVTTKANGKPAKVCADHAAADAARKPPRK